MNGVLSRCARPCAAAMNGHSRGERYKMEELR
jgi:hypothetical protein